MSATHLVTLYLWDIPNSGYFTPEAIILGLSTSASLEELWLEFESPLLLESQCPPPLTRSLDTPLLDDLHITFFHQHIFDTPQLTQFISRTPNLKTPGEACVVFSLDHVRVMLPQASPRLLELRVTCWQSNWQLSSLAHIYSALPQALIPTMEHLYIYDGYYLLPHWQDDIEDGQWLEVLHPFTSVKKLYLSRELTPFIAPALQEFVGERVTEVLPALQTLFLEEDHPLGPVQEAIGKFVAARQLAGHPIIVSHWEIVSHWDREDELSDNDD